MPISLMRWRNAAPSWIAARISMWSWIHPPCARVPLFRALEPTSLAANQPTH